MSRGSQLKHQIRAALASAALCCSATHAQPAPQPAEPQPAPRATPQSAPASTGQESRALGAPRATSASRPGDTPKPHSSGFGQTALALGGVLALAIGSAAGIKAIARARGGIFATVGPGGRAPAGIMEILGRYPVGRGCTLILLKIDRRILLISQSAGGRLGAGAGMTTLCELTDPEEIASILLKSRDADGDSMSERFRSLLTRFDHNMPADADAIPGRKLKSVVGGDRAELWDDGRIPIVDLTKQPGAQEIGAAGMLRRRLASFRAGGEGGRA